MAISGFVSTRLLPRMTAVAAALDGCGYGNGSRVGTSASVRRHEVVDCLAGTVPPLPYARCNEEVVRTCTPL